MARDEAKREEWRRRLERQRRSQQSLVEFCRDEKVSQAAYYYWSRILRQERSVANAVAPAQRSRVQAMAAPLAMRAEQFLPVTVLADEPGPVERGSGTLEVEFPRGVRVHVRAGCDRGLLHDVLNWCRGPAEGASC